MRKTTIAALTAAALLAVGCGSAGTDDDPGTPPAADAAEPTAKTAEGTVGPGTWQVGTEVKPGTYTATADNHCYWARLKNFDGGFESIIANGNLDSGQRGRITIKSSDKGIELSGDCTWVRDRKAK